jgi:hypothetical protein
MYTIGGIKGADYICAYFNVVIECSACFKSSGHRLVRQQALLTAPTQMKPVIIVIKIHKSYISPTTRQEGALGERRYSSYSFLTSAVDGCEWSVSRPGCA